MKLDAIYGTDENGMANSISSDALSQTKGSAGPLDTKGSKGNATDPGEVEVTGNKGDSRAKSKGN
jgi:hypothetical protein